MRATKQWVNGCGATVISESILGLESVCYGHCTRNLPTARMLSSGLVDTRSSSLCMMRRGLGALLQVICRARRQNHFNITTTLLA